MSEKYHWKLEEIRAAYREVEKHYNVLFPIQLGGKKKDETVLDAFDPEGDNFYLKVFPLKIREVLRKLKKAADQSGNAQTWRAGESLDGLSQGMKERIEKVLKFRI